MNLAERLAHRVLNVLFKRRDVWFEGELYLRRWFLTPTTWNTRLFLHFIGKSDDIHILHDHPWDFTTVILARGYKEYLPNGEFRIAKAGDRLKNKAEHVHAVSPNNGAAWTLMIVKQARRMWGFHTTTGWEPWRQYLKKPDAPDSPEDVIQPTV